MTWLLLLEFFSLCGLAALLCGLLGNTRPLKSLAVAVFFLAAILLIVLNINWPNSRELGLPPGEAGIAWMLLLELLLGVPILIVIISGQPVIFLVCLVLLSLRRSKAPPLNDMHKTIAFSVSFLFVLAAVIWFFVGREFL